MKRLLLLFSVALLMFSCGDRPDYQAMRNHSKAWVEKNVIPLYVDAHIMDMGTCSCEFKHMTFREDSLLAMHSDATWNINLMRTTQENTVALDLSDSVQVAEAKAKRIIIGKKISILESYKSAIDTVLHNRMKDYYVFDVKVDAGSENEDISVKLLLGKEANVLNPEIIAEKEE